jgi:hypothetical protein
VVFKNGKTSVKNTSANSPGLLYPLICFVHHAYIVLNFDEHVYIVNLESLRGFMYFENLSGPNIISWNKYSYKRARNLNVWCGHPRVHAWDSITESRKRELIPAQPVLQGAFPLVILFVHQLVGVHLIYFDFILFLLLLFFRLFLNGWW